MARELLKRFAYTFFYKQLEAVLEIILIYALYADVGN